MSIVSIKDSVQLYLWAVGSNVALTNAVGNKASIGDIGGDGAEEIDVTNMESDTKLFEAGYSDAGSFDITQFLSDTEYADMLAFKTAGETINWGVIINNRAGEKVVGLQGQGIVKNVKITGLSVGSAIQVVTTIRCSGSLTADFVAPTA